MINNWCAAWLILLVVSPFTAPFTVCDLNTALGRIVERDSMPANDVEERFVNGGVTLDLPVVPIAAEFKLASVAALGTAAFVEMAPAATFDAPPVAAIPLGRAPTLAILRL